VFVLGRPFQLSLIFASKARGYPREANFTLGWKGLSFRNTVPYYEFDPYMGEKLHNIGSSRF